MYEYRPMILRHTRAFDNNSFAVRSMNNMILVLGRCENLK